uniref:Uncharacterized protein n=1 Tax=Ditylenchus dipsaci TaxID=166011 RepID=A0A915E9C8_9BILA
MCFQDVISMVKSEKGNDMATHRGFRFMKHQKSGDGTKQYWKCDKTYGVVDARRVEDVEILAASQIHITSTGGQEQILLGDSGADGEDSERPGTEVTMTQKHNHFGDKSRVDLKRMQGNVQEQAISSKEAPRAILGRAIESVDEDSRPLIRRSYVARNIRSKNLARCAAKKYDFHSKTFTPIEEVSMAFIKLREYLEDSRFAEQMEPILDYFEDSYVGRPNGGKRRKPRFAIVQCNVVKLVLSDRQTSQSRMWKKTKVRSGRRQRMLPKRSKYCSNVDFAAASKTFGFNVLLFSSLSILNYTKPNYNTLIGVEKYNFIFVDEFTCGRFHLWTISPVDEFTVDEFTVDEFTVDEFTVDEFTVDEFT